MSQNQALFCSRKILGKKANLRIIEINSGKIVVQTQYSDALWHTDRDIIMKYPKKGYATGRLLGTKDDPTQSFMQDNITEVSYIAPYVHYITYKMTNDATYGLLKLSSATIIPIIEKGIKRIVISKKDRFIGCVTQEILTVYDSQSIKKQVYPLPSQDTLCKISPSGTYVGIKETLKGIAGTLQVYKQDKKVCIQETNIIDFDLSDQHCGYIKADRNFYIRTIKGKEEKCIESNIDMCFFLLSGTYVALIYNHYTIHIWDIASPTFRKVCPLAAHMALITCMVPIANDSVLITGSENGMLRQWDLQHKQEKASFLHSHPADHTFYKYSQFSKTGAFLFGKDTPGDDTQEYETRKRQSVHY